MSSKPKKNVPSAKSFPAPTPLEFFWAIDDVNAKKPRTLQVSGGDTKNDHAVYVFPPKSSSDFVRERKGKLFLWSDGESNPAEISRKTLEEYSVASVAFQPRQDNFLALSKDCTLADHNQKGKGKIGSGWCKIGFHHKKQLSQVDFVGEKEGLATRARDSPWMPQVLPMVYDCHDSLEDKPSGGLCGKLALIIGMAAFSDVVDEAEVTVQCCLKKGRWEHHLGKLGAGRINPSRIVVAKIYFDPDSDTKPGHLKSFEDGLYGPILTASLSPSTETAMSSRVLSKDQSAMHYTMASSTTVRQPNTMSTAPRYFEPSPAPYQNSAATQGNASYGRTPQTGASYGPSRGGTENYHPIASQSQPMFGVLQPSQTEMKYPTSYEDDEVESDHSRRD